MIMLGIMCVYYKVDKLASILSGEKPIYLNLQFLIRNDKTDPLILKQTKVKLDTNLVGG